MLHAVLMTHVDADARPEQRCEPPDAASARRCFRRSYYFTAFDSEPSDGFLGILNSSWAVCDTGRRTLIEPGEADVMRETATPGVQYAPVTAAIFGLAV